LKIAVKCDNLLESSDNSRAPASNPDVPPPKTEPSVELEQWLRNGELARAAEWLVRQYASDVYGVCAAMVRDRAAAEDLAQEAFSKALGNLRGYRGEASPRTWLIAITRNHCIDYLRARQREAPDARETFEADAYPDDAPLPAELLARQEDVRAALSSLAETDRALVVLRFRQGLDYAEIAEAFGLREGTVRMRLSRALARMRAALEAPRGAPPVFAAAPSPMRARALPEPAAAGRRSAGAPPRIGAPVAAAAIGPTFRDTLQVLMPEPTPAFCARLLTMARSVST
jgi:RNA polymerase sigma-70 factor (ECF subfamily)